MSYQRLYPQRINWEDEPSLATPINQVNLNKMDSALYGIDGRVVELDENKVGKTETFNTSRNGVVPKPTQADITAEKVLRADGTWVEQSGGGGGGGGHTIVNNAGTSLTQRGKLKTVGGLNATDDGANNTTEITDVVEEVPWSTWQSYPSEEAALQAHPNCVVTGAPDCDGDIEIENLHLAWSNPNPASTFANQQIPLNTDGNYTHFRAKFKIFYTDTNYFWRDFKKGENVFIETNDLANLRLCRRGINSTSDTQLTIGSGVIRDTFNSSGQPADDGRYVIPIEIYTYNKDLTAKIQAIARNVSTEASKCMLSDGETSVADALNYSTLEHVVGKWIDGSTLYEKTIDFGAMPNNTTKTVAHGITNMNRCYEIKGVMFAGTTAYVLPYPDVVTNANNIWINCTLTNISIRTGANYSSNNAYITIRYTKTS